MELPRVPPPAATPAVATLIAAASSRPGAPARDGRVSALRELMRDLQDRSHTRVDDRLAGLGGLGVLEATLAAVFVLSFVAKDELGASFALQALGNLAMNDANRARLAELAAIECVTACMGAHATSARVAKDAIVALRHLAYENDANKQRAVDAGVVAAVVRAMLACGDSAAVQRQACGAISILAVHSALGDAAKRTILAAGALSAITRALTTYKSDTQLVTAGVKALGTLVGLAEARTVARESGAVPLLEALAAAPEHAGSREFGEAMRQTLRRLVGK
jgi:hypothetical protein